MRQFYLELKEEIWKPLVSKLTWSHIYKLLTIENTNKRNYYINQCIKIREFKKQDIGQIKLYMNYIDQHIKKPTNNKTVGIIICREENRFVLKYVKELDMFITKYITI